MARHQRINQSVKNKSKEDGKRRKGYNQCIKAYNSVRYHGNNNCARVLSDASTSHPVTSAQMFILNFIGWYRWCVDVNTHLWLKFHGIYYRLNILFIYCLVFFWFFALINLVFSLLLLFFLVFYPFFLHSTLTAVFKLESHSLYVHTIKPIPILILKQCERFPRPPSKVLNR